MILPIAKSPAHILRRPTRPVGVPLDKKGLRLIKDMIDTVRSADGVGLAAPQVGQDLRMALIYLEAWDITAFPIINPEVVELSDERVVMEEGCLSLPGVYGLVERPKKVKISAVDASGKEFTISDDGFLARVILHEIDHLNNTLIMDKLQKITAGADLLSRYQGAQA